MIKRRSPSEKAKIVMESITTGISTAELCRKYNLSPNAFYLWKDRFLQAGKASFSRTSDGGVCRQLQSENESLKRMVGEMTMANDVLKKTLEAGKR